MFFCGLVFVLAARSGLGLDDDRRDANSLQVQVDRLVRQLGAPTLNARSTAEEELAQLGADALAVLPDGELIGQPAIRDAVRRIRLRLERIAADEAMRPALVTLTGKLTLADVAEALSEQTGNRVEVPEHAEELPITTDWRDVTFWDAVRDLCDRYALRCTHGGAAAHRLAGTHSTAGGGVVLEPGSALPSARQVMTSHGPFLIVFGDLSKKPISTDSDGEPAELWRIACEVALEPRLRGLTLNAIAQRIELLVGENRLAQWNPKAEYEIPFGPTGQPAPLTLEFVSPREAATPHGKDAVRLKGDVSVTVASRVENVVFDKLALVPGTVRRKGQASIQLLQVERYPTSQSLRRVRLQVRYDGSGAPFESHHTWLAHSPVYLENSPGALDDELPARRGPREVQTLAQGDGAATLEYLFDDLPAEFVEIERRREDQTRQEFHLVFELPTLTGVFPFEFELAIPDSAVLIPAGNSR